ncbi:hypothetical protein Kisp02_15030 [Kineosporia sp. NBRC 101731]|nr:hypothetical protein Kisp02_15030 [Kineosporia sp. NBRC 101731]
MIDQNQAGLVTHLVAEDTNPPVPSHFSRRVEQSRLPGPRRPDQEQPPAPPPRHPVDHPRHGSQLVTTSDQVHSTQPNVRCSGQRLEKPPDHPRTRSQETHKASDDA